MEKYGLPAWSEVRMLPRVLLAYRGRNKGDKRRLLGWLYGGIAGRVLPQRGERPTWMKLRTQEDIGRTMSMSRQTLTRHISIFSPAATSAEWRREQGERIRAAIAKRSGSRTPAARPGSQYRHRQARAARLRLHGRPGGRWRPFSAGTELLERKRSYSGPDRYNLKLGELAGERFHYLSLEELRARFPGDWLGEDQATDKPRKEDDRSGVLHVGGYKAVPAWIWSPAYQVTTIARLVMTVFFLWGFAEQDDKGQVKAGRGVWIVKQETIATALGISCDSVTDAWRQWTAEGVVRTAPTKARLVNNQMKGGPVRVIWLADRVISRDEAIAETSRFLAAADRARLREHVEFALAASLHGALLSEWSGQEHQLRTFWTELRRRYQSAGIPSTIADALLPRPPD